MQTSTFFASFAVVLALITGCGQDPSPGFKLASDFRPPVLGNEPLEHNPNALVGLPRLRTAAEEVFISRSSYLLSFAPARRGLHWAAWRLRGDDLGVASRQNNYELDSDLEAYLGPRGGHAVGTDEYKGTCYDRGHQVPSADRTRTVDENRLTFKMSNMMPQTAYLNRVLWEHLESYERTLVRAGKKLIIFSGGLNDIQLAPIGPNHDISVPSAYFKVIAELADGHEPQVVVAVIMPNVTSGGIRGDDDREGLCADAQEKDLAGKAGSDAEDWRRYVTTLEEVERRAGMTWPFLRDSH